MFENMDYIYEIYREGSFSKAAKKLYISQPSLSATVRRVEERLGYPIFDRGTKPLKLTEFGMRYMESVLAVRKIEKDFAEYVNDYGELKTGMLKLGGTNLVSSLIAPRMINEFREHYPHVTVELREGITQDLEEMLGSGELDLVMDYSMPYGAAFDFVKLADEFLMLAVPAAFPINEALREYAVDMEDIKNGAALSGRYVPVPLNEFREVPFVMLRKQNDTYKRAVKMCEDAGFEPRTSFEAAQQMTAYHVCSSGMGAAFVSSMLLSRVPANPGLVYYRLDSDACRRELCLLWKRERYFTRAMESFRTFAMSSSLRFFGQ